MEHISKITHPLLCVGKHVCALVVDYICMLMHIRIPMCPCRGVHPRMCVFVNVSYLLPLIIAGHIHVWHLPLTSAPQQVQLLKGQTLQRMSITSTLSLPFSPSTLLPPFLPLLFSTSDSLVVLIWSGKEGKSWVSLTWSLIRWSSIFSWLHTAFFQHSC